MEQRETGAALPPTPPLTLQPGAGGTLAAVAHDAHNMVAALGLYCDLLEEPGVFAEPYRHYGDGLKTVATASRGLVDKLLALCAADATGSIPHTDSPSTEMPLAWPAPAQPRSKSSQYWNEIVPTPITNLAWELETNRNLLAALAGPSIQLTVDAVRGELPVRLSSEDFTRILVNLVKNAVEAMPDSDGRIQFILRECQNSPEEGVRLLLNIEDNGTGIPCDALESIFEAGFTTRSTPETTTGTRTPHRGLGLSITRSILDSAGGSIRAANRDPHGACIQIELPVRNA